MKIILHEIELNSDNPDKSKQFYSDILGLNVNIDIEGLKCYHAGYPGVEINKSIHFPRKTSISFLVDDIKEFIKIKREQGIDIEDPKPAHLEMIATSITDPDGIRIAIQQPTEKSPDWLKKIIL
jgi:catechol 2,3-dioxygenase-like lactoylglutathione lyase family enzyme